MVLQIANEGFMRISPVFDQTVNYGPKRWSERFCGMLS